MSRRLVSGLVRPFLWLSGVHTPDILSIKDFRALIERERSRADRNSHGFSLVIFKAGSATGKERVSRELGGILRSRIRFTDELGWLGASEIGILLPDTHPDGARKFSDYVRCAVMNRNGCALEYRVYSYPESLSDGPAGQDDDRQLRFDELLVETEPDVSVRPPSQASVGAPGSGDRQTDTEGSGAAEWSVDSADGVIEEVVAQRLPAWKRTVDVVVAAVALILLSPIMAITAVLIKMVSRGPVLFKQERVGHMGKTFTCLKFRTMHVDSDHDGHRDHFRGLIKSGIAMTKLDHSGHDPRLISLGKIVRQTAMDELPQLINVLRGEMSLIGPRPCIPYEYKDYSRWHRQRVQSMPGLTGLWQVNGKNRTTFEEMMRFDIAYGRKKNPLLDLAIIFKTVPVIVTQAVGGFSNRLRT